jgi:uncharacterized protein (TIGR03083 family)
MDATTLTTHLFDEYARFTAALADAEPDAPVPPCPGWTAADLSWHVTEVYLHKARVIQTGEWPTPWPPERDSVPLADAFTELTGEFTRHEAAEFAKTFDEGNQTVGFWIRRMAQETAIHRVDAELTAGLPVTPIEDDLAVDGIDELLVLFLADATVQWHDEFAEMLAAADQRPVRLTTDGGDWLVTATPERVSVARTHDGASSGATVSGSPDGLLRFLWNRGTDAITISGDQALVAQLQKLLVTATQ